MKGFVIFYLCVNVLGLLVSLGRFGSAEPWPREREPKTAALEAIEVVIHLAVIAWAACLVWGDGH